MLSHTIGVDDAPFDREFRGDVPVVLTAFSSLRLEGIFTARVRRDGRNSTDVLAERIASSRFARHTQLVLLQGIALAGFNVVDLSRLADRLGVGVVVVARRAPDLAAIRRALLERVPGGARKWRLIVSAGLMERIAVGTTHIHVQRAGVSLEDTTAVMRQLCAHGHIPEPLRVAHLVAGALVRGESRGRC
jgi:uncharacterized protein